MAKRTKLVCPAVTVLPDPDDVTDDCERVELVGDP